MVSSWSTISLAFLCMGVGFSAAVPAVKKSNIAPVDDAMLSSFKLMGQYASAAYCRSNYNSPGDQIECNDGSCPLVQAANATSVIEYNSELATDVTGYVALDPTNELIVISFRGSSSIENWITNLDFKAVSTNLCSGCTAHRGFWQSWLDSRSVVVPAVQTLLDANPTYQVVTTGHSLGGAIATLAAADMRSSGYAVKLYTFGAPRVSSSKLANYITAQTGGNYRVTHWNDPVPNIPPIIMDFAHVSPEYYINKKNNQAVEASDFKIYEGIMNLKGNASWLLTDILAHFWYFGKFPAVKCMI